MTEPANSQETPPPSPAETPDPVDPKLKKLQDELALINVRKDIAEAEKALRDAQNSKFDLSETKGQDGTTTLDAKAGFYAEILAYKSIDNISDEITGTLGSKVSNKNVYLMDSLDLSTQTALLSLINSRIQRTESDLQAIITTFPNGGNDYEFKNNEAITTALLAAPAILGAVSDIASFFRQNITVSGRDVSIDNLALKASIANSMNTAKTHKPKKIIFPETILNPQNSSINTKLASLSQNLNDVQSIKEVLKSHFEDKISANAQKIALETVRQKAVNDKLVKAIAAGSNTMSLEKQLAQISLNLENLNGAQRRWNEISSQIDSRISTATELYDLITAKSDGKNSILETISVVDKITKDNDAVLLLTKVVSQGADIESAKTSFSQGRVSYIGGAVVTYILTDKDGSYLASGSQSGLEAQSFKRSEGAETLR